MRWRRAASSEPDPVRRVDFLLRAGRLEAAAQALLEATPAAIGRGGAAQVQRIADDQHARSGPGRQQRPGFHQVLVRDGGACLHGDPAIGHARPERIAACGLRLREPVAGDLHRSMLRRIPREGTYALPEIIASPLATPRTWRCPPPSLPFRCSLWRGGRRAPATAAAGRWG